MLLKILSGLTLIEVVISRVYSLALCRQLVAVLMKQGDVRRTLLSLVLKLHHRTVTGQFTLLLLSWAS